MASVHIDSELMLHQMPSSTFSSAFSFTAAVDAEQKPLIFGVSRDKHFFVLKRNQRGSHDHIDLSAKLNLQGDVEAFVVSQSRDASRCLFIAVAVANGASGSQIHILKPITAWDLDLDGAELKRKLVLNAEPPNGIGVTKLFAGSSDSQDWPLLVATYHMLSGTAKEDLNISRVTVYPSRWELSRDLAIPQTTKGVIDMCAVRSYAGDGLVVLNKDVNGSFKLFFTTTELEPDGRTQTELRLPSSTKPTSLATAQEPGGTNVFIVGNGLYMLNYADLTESGTIVTQLSSHSAYAEASRLTLAQAGDTFTAWFQTGEQVVTYQRAQTDGTLIGEPVPLLPPSSEAGKTVQYVPILHSSLVSQSLVLRSDANELVVMEQSTVTGLWVTTPLMVEEVGTVMEVNAFVTHIEIKGKEDGMPSVMAPYVLSSSSFITTIVNGVEHALGRTPMTVETNERGVITLIVPVDGISTPTFTLSDPLSSSPDAEPLRLGEPIVIDPTVKVFDRLTKAISASSDIRELKSPNGHSMIEPGSGVSKEDAEAAAKALKDLSTVRAELIQGHQVNFFTAATAISITEVSSPWEFWQWIKQGVRRAYKYTITKLGDAWTFVVKLGQQAWNFVLDTVERVVECAKYVLDKVKAAWNWVKDTVGFIFNWGDIKATAESIKVVVRSSLTYAANFIAKERYDVGDSLDRTEKLLFDAFNIKLPGDITDKKQNAADTNKGATQYSAGNDEAASGAPANTGPYHYEQGLKSKNLPQMYAGQVVGALESVWDNLLAGPVKAIGTEVEAIAKNVAKTFAEKKEITAGDILQQIGAALIRLIMTFVRALTQGLMKIGEDVIIGLRNAIDTPIEFPVISALLRKIGIPTFSYLDVLALVIAFPVTTMSKVLTGKAPKRITSFDYTAICERGEIDQASMDAFTDLGDWVGICGSFIWAAVQSAKMMTQGAVPAVSVFGLVTEIALLAYAVPWKGGDPGHDFRLLVFYGQAAQILVHFILQKAVPGASGQKIAAGLDVGINLIVFSLRQAVHAEEFNASHQSWDEKDDIATGLSVASSVYDMVRRQCASVGVVTIIPHVKVAAVAGLACSSLLKSAVDGARKGKLKPLKDKKAETARR
ncbi:hypothetical protein DFH09DRAFT_1360111 [Mycena vulgaris]|nr:hypothetical protein DFH09DRAFT_1360111 [Mycena vulgaris]